MKPRLGRLLARLDHDEAGNMYVLYIAASLLLVAMLWAIIGAGSRLVQHETLQTSADAAAYSSAVVRAKGLNLIAFCNLLLAALFGLLVVHRLLVFAFLAVGIPAQIDPVYTARVVNAMQSVAQMERAINALYPALALAESAAVGTHPQYRRNHGRGKLLAAAWPMPRQLLAAEPPRAIPLGGLCDYANAVYPSYLQRVSWPSPPAFGLLRQRVVCSDDELPTPLVLPDGWDARSKSHGVALIEDAQVSARRRATSLGVRERAPPPASDHLVMAAEAEVFPLHGALDLWHMNWRARLVAYQPGDLRDRDAMGVLPEKDVNELGDAIAYAQSLPAYQRLAGEFLQH